MGNLSVLIGAGIIAFILVYMIFKLGRENNGENNHALLQLLLLFLLIGNFVIIGKAVYDDKDNCAWLSVNATTSGTQITYDYDYVCETNEATTANILYNAILWLVRLIALYIFVYYSWLGLGKLTETVRVRRRR